LGAGDEDESEKGEGGGDEVGKDFHGTSGEGIIG
jgi:hypothetical protein